MALRTELLYFNAMTSVSSSVYFQTSDNTDSTFWICGSTEALTCGNVQDVQIALDLEPTTSMADADALSALLRKHVKAVRLWTSV